MDQSSRGSSSSSRGHRLSGNVVDAKNKVNAATTRHTYTAYPPSQLRSSEGAKSDVDAAGPTARITDAINCATPLTAPRERLLGTEDVMKMNIAPVDQRNVFGGQRTCSKSSMGESED